MLLPAQCTGYIRIAANEYTLDDFADRRNPSCRCFEVAQHWVPRSGLPPKDIFTGTPRLHPSDAHHHHEAPSDARHESARAGRIRSPGFPNCNTGEFERAAVRLKVTGGFRTVKSKTMSWLRWNGSFTAQQKEACREAASYWLAAPSSCISVPFSIMPKACHLVPIERMS